jgi:dihydroxyacetone kinase-like protein
MDWAAMINAISAAISADSDRLDRLDSALGDGDHGTGLSGGFAAAAERVTELDMPDASTVFKTTASALMNAMGGSSGALYGSLFLRAGMVAQTLNLETTDGLSQAFEAGLDAVMKRGGAQPGDKTMVDALSPAVKLAATENTLPAAALMTAAAAATEGAESTVQMVARHGRAKFIGERSLGHPDAGASSVAIMFDAIAYYWKEQSHA